MMTKFVVRGSDPPEPTVEFWLTQSGGNLHLEARAGMGDEQVLLEIRPDGSAEAPRLFDKRLQEIFGDRLRVEEGP